MSELRIALVAEGPTDGVIIEAALRAILDRPFTVAHLQPESTRPQMGAGWCGVFRWCREFAARALASLEEDPTLPGFDLFVIQIDADVADKSYEDGGRTLVVAAQDLPSLPCARLCPPPSDTADELRGRLTAWLGLEHVGPRTVFCVPSKAIEAWLAAGFLEPSHPLLVGLECNLEVADRVAQLPMGQRVRRRTGEYQRRAPAVTTNWDRVSTTCTQAERFHREVCEALASADIP